MRTGSKLLDEVRQRLLLSPTSISSLRITAAKLCLENLLRSQQGSQHDIEERGGMKGQAGGWRGQQLLISL